MTTVFTNERIYVSEVSLLIRNSRIGTSKVRYLANSLMNANVRKAVTIKVNLLQMECSMCFFEEKDQDQDQEYVY